MNKVNLVTFSAQIISVFLISEVNADDEKWMCSRRHLSFSKHDISFHFPISSIRFVVIITVTRRNKEKRKKARP